MASQMKSAGKRLSKTSPFSNGWCHCATGMEPESNQASITSGTRFISAPQVGQGKTTSST
jgi:hypothetical protein